MGIGTIIMSAIGIIMFVVGIYGGLQRKVIKSRYKGVFNYFTAYFFLCFIIAPPLIMTDDGSLGLSLPLKIVCSIGSLVLAVLLGLFTYKRCPEELRKSVLIMMLVYACGVTLRVVLFFLTFLWSHTAPAPEAPAGNMPEWVTGSDGSRCKVQYDGSGNPYFWDPKKGDVYLRKNGSGSDGLSATEKDDPSKMHDKA